MAVAVADPVGVGLVASFARPGGNITALSLLNPEISGKRIELLKEVVPRISRAAFLVNPANPTGVTLLRETQVAARALGVELLPLEVRGS